MNNVLSRRLRQEAVRDRGDTLIEVLIAIGITATAAAALIGTVLMSITASSEHRSLAVSDTLLKSYSANAQNAIERQAGFQSCATTYAVSAPTGMPAGYTVAISSIKYWNGTSFVTSCTAPNTVQLITITATAPAQLSSSLSFAVRDPR